MKQKEMIELILQHHPGMNETQARNLLNRAQKDFSSRTEILETSYAVLLTKDLRFYPLHPTGQRGKVVTVTDVEVDGKLIPRLVGAPLISDFVDEGVPADDDEDSPE